VKCTCDVKARFKSKNMCTELIKFWQILTDWNIEELKNEWAGQVKANLTKDRAITVCTNERTEAAVSIW
jgi:hypothetical protein